MKVKPTVSSSRRKSRKAHFASDSTSRRVLMSSRLAKDLREKYGVRSMPIRKDDEVKIMTGLNKGREGKVTQVYRKKFCIHVERVTRDKANGTPVPIPVNASNVQIIKLKLDKDRLAILGRKGGKGEDMKNVD